MSILLGGGRGKGPTRINDLAIQTSAQGIAISKGWGTGRLKMNLIWYGAFKSKTKKEKSGGKGAPKTTSYSYSASIIGGLASGPISSILRVYRDKEVLSLSASGLSLAVGNLGQPIWGYLTTFFPTQALGYSGISYVYASNYPLTDSASLQNHSFEVQFPIRVPGKPDANPADIIQDILENPHTGIRGWIPSLLVGLEDYGDYCLANNLLFSPILENQIKASEFIETQLIEATSAKIFWSEGLLKIKPMGDTSATANGVTWTPNLTPAYDLNEDDFLSSPQLEILDQTEAYNRVEIEYLDRNNQYNTAVEPAYDLSDIIENGERKEDTESIHSICDKNVAVKVANLRLQRKLYLRERWRFSLPDAYSLLEQSDIVTLTTSTDGLLLDRKPVRILEINEEGRSLEIIAEALLSDTASAALYNTHPSDGYIQDTGVSPGSVTNPSLINAPLSLTGGMPEVWLAVSGDDPNWGGCEVWASSDDLNYSFVGNIAQPGRYGDLTLALSNSTDPDPSGAFQVDLSDSRGTLISVSDEVRDTGGTLSLIGAELISYKTANLVTANTYTISDLRRGLYGTTISSHAIGSKFTRIDGDILKVPYDALGLGTVGYFKFLSYNLWGNALEELSDVSSYNLPLVPMNAGVLNFGSYSLVLSDNLSFMEGKITKIAGGSGWNSQAYSLEPLNSGAKVSFIKGDNSTKVTIGLNSDPSTSSSWENIDYAIQVDESGNAYVVQSGNTVFSTTSAAGDLFTVERKDGLINYYKNSTLVYSNAASSLPLYFDSSFYSEQSFISSLIINTPGDTGVSGSALALVSDRTAITYSGAGLPVPSTQTTTFIVQKSGGIGSTVLVMTRADGTLINNPQAYLTPNTPTAINLMPYSDQFSFWLGVATVDSDYAVAPDGTVTADRITDPNGSGFDGRQQSIVIPADGTIYICSWFVKKTTGVSNCVMLRVNLQGGTVQVNRDVYVNTNSGNIRLVGGASATIRSVGDYWLVQSTVTNNGTNTGLDMLVFPAIGFNVGDQPAPTLDAGATGSVIVWRASVSYSLEGYLIETGSLLRRGIVTGNASLTESNFSSAASTDVGIRVIALAGSQAGVLTSVASLYRNQSGADGLTNALVKIYQRASSTPTLPSVAATYTFATNDLTGLNNGWTQLIPAADGNPLYVAVAVASGSGATDTIAAGEWSSPVIETGAGINTAAVFIYQRTTTNPAPAAPTTTATYNFATGAITGLNNGWTADLPASGGSYRWRRQAAASSTGPTDTIAAGEWAAAQLLAEDGTSSFTVSPASQSFVIAATSNGTPKTLQLPKTITFMVLQGATDISNDAGTTYSVSASNCTATLGGTNNKVLTISAMAADSATATVTVQRSGTTIATVIVTLEKSRDGATGGTSNVDTTLNINNTVSYSGTQGGPFTVPVGPNGTINLNVDHGYSVGTNTATLSGKVQYRTTPGSGAWIDVGSEVSGTTAFVGEPGALGINQTLSGPASAATWEFQYINRKTGSGTLSNSGSASFYVGWGA